MVRPNARIPTDPSKPGVSLTSGDKMVLDYGWINLLISVVKLAPCNSQEFEFKEFVVPDSLDEDKFQETIVAKYNTSPGRFKILKEAVRFITPEMVNTSDDEQIVKLFAELVSDGRINGSAITGLSSHELTDRNGTLLCKGVEILKDIAVAYTQAKQNAS